MYRSHRRGLTPLETLIIAAIVAAFALMLSWRFVGDQQDDARKVTIERVQLVMDGLERYAIDHGGSFPTTDEGLQVLIGSPAGDDRPSRWNGPYVDSADCFTDGWQAPLQYVSPVTGDEPYHLWSSGADRAEGGEGADADIESWDRSSMVP